MFYIFRLKLLKLNDRDKILKKLGIAIIFFLLSCSIVMIANADQKNLINLRKQEIKKTISQLKPIMKFDALKKEQERAQIVALENEKFLKYTKTANGENFLNQIFGVYPIQARELNKEKGSGYRVEMYNFGLNLSTVAFIDEKEKVEVMYFKDTQPDINFKLKKLALYIATNSMEVQKALGYKPEEAEALMASTKTSLNATKCERSRHLCVAPTFVKEDKALWAVVDLTDLKLVGIRWTNVGEAGPPIVTERSIQNENMSNNFCEEETNLAKGQWNLNYHLTTSDGLEVKNVSYKGKLVLDSVKLVDWHVNYSRTEGFGYSDAVGCPIFSQAAVIAVNPPIVEDIDGGFSITQEYFNQGWPTPCNYNYVQKYDFYDDGRFRVRTASVGRGCGNDGTYRPVFRIAFSGSRSFSKWEEQDWQVWKNEQWSLQGETTRYSPKGYLYKINSKEEGYFIEPSVGQFGDGGRGDNAYIYVTKHKHEEGDRNLITIGPCCNTDHNQGPEKFLNGENINNEKLVVWYVPQMDNDDRKGKEYCWADSIIKDGITVAKSYPCYGGPMFHPINKS